MKNGGVAPKTKNPVGMKNTLLLRFLFILLAWSVLSDSAAQTTALRQGQDKSLVLAHKGLAFGFFMPETSGYLRLGCAVDGKSFWLDEAVQVQSKKVNRGYELRIGHASLGKGILRIAVQPLSDSNGLILCCEGVGIPAGCSLLWSYGGCSADTLPQTKTALLSPGQCKDNVFSREINAFTVYYGTTTRLKVMMGVFPLETQTRLADAHRMPTPLGFWESGKKTDAPALAARCPLTAGNPLYTCIYRQNQSADYNYYMLPALFEKEAEQKNTFVNENAKPHTDFGPDFHQH